MAVIRRLDQLAARRQQLLGKVDADRAVILAGLSRGREAISHLDGLRRMTPVVALPVLVAIVIAMGPRHRETLFRIANQGLKKLFAQT
jgi:hypothetical protein